MYNFGSLIMVKAQLIGHQYEDGSWAFLLEAITSKSYSCDKIVYWWDGEDKSAWDVFECMRAEFYLYQRLVRGQHTKLVYAEFHEYDGTLIIPSHTLTSFL